MIKEILILFLGTITLVSQVHAECNTCNENLAMCVNATAFQMCLDSKTILSQIVSCPLGEVCTAETGICKPEDDYKPDCPNPCGRCSNGIACVSETQFSPCDADNKTIPIIIDCPDRKYCNTNEFNVTNPFCVESCSGSPICIKDLTEKPADEESYKSSCSPNAKAGSYPNKSDKTCKTYVYCETQDATSYSILLSCTNGYFDKDKKLCVPTRPSYCSV